VIGALGVGRRLTGATAARAVAFGSVVTGTALLFASVAPTLAVALAMFLFGGAANGTENVGMRTLVQSLVPDELRGRAFAAYEGTLVSAVFLAMAMGGLAVDWLGPRGTIGTAGAGAVVVGSFGILQVSRARRRALAQ
jgi:MFS family permease